MRDMSTRILAQGVTASNDTWSTEINNNDMIIGPSGAGKTRGYVIPNVIASEGSLIVTDTKNNLYRALLPYLQKKGYDVQCVDFVNCAQSLQGYNPLDYVQIHENKPSDQDMLRVATALCPVENLHDPFWDLAARGVLASLIGYTMLCLPLEECNLHSVCRLFLSVLDNRYEKMLAELENDDPECFAVRQFASARAGKDAEKMTASIRGIVGEKLAPYDFEGVQRLFTMPERVDFAAMRRKKTALFINVSDTDRSMDRLISLFYAQAMQALCNTPEAEGETFYPVRMIMDDFASGCCVPDFDRVISVVRSRHLYLSIIIQSLSQLESLYGASRAATILNNCDTLLYLGGNDVTTAQYIGSRANRPSHAILSMPTDEALLFQRGQAARKVKRYKLEEHYDISN